MRKSTILSLVVITAASIGSVTQAATTTASWTKIASQSAPFTVAGTKAVRFGSGSQWVTKITTSGQCTVAFFGKDPAPGITKQCQVWSLGTTAAAPTSYSVTLKWSIPTTRQDGRPLALSELKGYEVYYATDSNTSTVNDTIVPVVGGTMNSSVISKLPAGTYYFSISAIDSNGLKSRLSSMVSAKVGS
jgi:hypothetical protein